MIKTTLHDMSARNNNKAMDSRKRE